MIDVALLFGRVVLLALLYLFLFAAARTGVGIVRAGAPERARNPVLRVSRGPRQLAGMRIPIEGAVVIGRSPEADLVVGDEFVSARHARVSKTGDEVVVEDLGSTNGTLLNGRPVSRATALEPGDVIGLGPVELTLERT